MRSRSSPRLPISFNIVSLCKPSSVESSAIFSTVSSARVLTAGPLGSISPVSLSVPSTIRSPLIVAFGAHIACSNATAVSITVICILVERSSIPVLPNS